MHLTFPRSIRSSRSPLAIGALVGLLALAACGKDSSSATGPDPLPPSATYDGVVMLSSGTGGSVHLVFDQPVARVVGGRGTSSSVAAEPSCSAVCGTVLGAVISSGTYNADGSVTFTFTFDGYDYTATAKLVGGRLTGTLSGGPTEAEVAGDFTAYASQAGEEVQAYCGSWLSSDQTDVGGGWYFLIAGSEVSGLVNLDGATAKITGTKTGNELSFDGNATQSGVTATVKATGSITEGASPAITGSYQASALGQTDHGTWHGDLCDLPL
jgi:hypothetical protein